MPEITRKKFVSDFASSTTRLYLWCMRISHPQIDTLRLVNDKRPLSRSDGEYQAFPFEPIPPTQTDQRPPEFEIDVDIVDHRIMAALRSLRGLKGEVSIQMERVWIEEPNDPTWGPAVYRFTGFKTDGIAKGTISASFIPGALDNVYPVARFSPANAS